MKINSSHIVFIAFFWAGSACQKDNYHAPASLLTGQIQYKGEAIGVERNQVPFQLYQPGYGKTGPINGSFSQVGTFSSLLFDGNYKFLIPSGQGPFIWKELSPGIPDTLMVTMKGNQTLNVEVTPYYMIRDPQITGASGMVTALCKIEKIITDANAKDIERVSLYINKGQFVSGGDNIAGMDIAGSSIADPDHIMLSVSVPAIVPAQTYVYVRIGVKIAGVEDLIYSPVQKISF
ncbi:DUF3823 domain-containing protein [Flavitalea flava]